MLVPLNIVMDLYNVMVKPSAPKSIINVYIGRTTMSPMCNSYVGTPLEPSKKYIVRKIENLSIIYVNI